jgi:hypothetical protein
MAKPKKRPKLPAISPLIIAGVVRGGVVVLEGSAILPDGAHVSIVMAPSDVPAELREEFAAWERANDEAEA